MRRTRGKFMGRRLMFLAVIFFIATALRRLGSDVKGEDVQDHDTGQLDDPDRHGVFLRRLASARYTEVPGVEDERNETGNNADEDRNCTPPTIHEFPADIFSNEDRKRGAVILHCACVVYMFVALALVCDDYFVSSLEKICERLGFSHDVAGATFMAAGSSAPELFTSIIGVFIAKGDVGVGTIVGSAVFNILVIIGLCGLFAGQVVPLTWWPMARDTVVYSISVLTLMCVIYDGRVTWYESLLMLAMYAGYIFLMWLNPKISHNIHRKQEKRKAKKIAKRLESCNNRTSIQLEQVTPLKTDKDDTANGDTQPAPSADENSPNSPKRLTFSDAGLRLMLTKQFPARTRMRTACWLVIAEQKHAMEAQKEAEFHAFGKEPTGNSNGALGEAHISAKRPSLPREEITDDEISAVIEIEAPDGLCQVPEGKCAILRWLMCLPLSTLLFFTIPDCRRKRFENWYMATFFMSVLWIAMFSYVMVWMVALIGFTLHIPDTVMGLAFLAAGTSVPDAMASLIVARQGLGDMAVSNSIGSNVFDVLLGLALPWFIKTTMINYGSVVRINSKGLLYSVVLLFATVAITIITIHCHKWNLTKRVGILLFAFYAIFLTFAILVELNVFGYVNPPVCVL
ncbi:sodium/potassium/calcium exchanger 3-like [Patiria miniata]|uniref:Sodium/calcium exchanger membrane region domain-containing protein n=1 Tax=Patiria miniata TaxID=46514 RepID=A0A914BFR7_PATMI|nr:sodium/potassium/calcium exchanger 3-like [Patiria miniata]